eukprot:scaffold3145_cov101-Isochrysis_galbana.AAC.5
MPEACLLSYVPACQTPAYSCLHAAPVRCRQSDDCLLLLLLLHICRQLDARNVPALLRARLPDARLLLPACCAGQMPDACVLYSFCLHFFSVQLRLTNVASFLLLLQGNGNLGLGLLACLFYMTMTSEPFIDALNPWLRAYAD